MKNKTEEAQKRIDEAIKKYEEADKISLCLSCHCITKKTNSKCNKCGAESKLTQEELNERLVKCDYGYSMYPANMWTREDLERVEKVMGLIKQIEEVKRMKLDDETILGILRNLSLNRRKYLKLKIKKAVKKEGLVLMKAKRWKE